MTAPVVRARRARTGSSPAALWADMAGTWPGRRSPRWRIRSATVQVAWADWTEATASRMRRSACSPVSAAGCACAGRRGDGGAAGTDKGSAGSMARASAAGSGAAGLAPGATAGALRASGPPPGAAPWSGEAPRRRAGAKGSRAPASPALACADQRRTSAARSSGSLSFPRRVAWLAHWRKLASARASGARPNCASYACARRAVSGPMLWRREENMSISAWPTSAISRPCPSRRCTQQTPNRRVSAFSIAKVAIAEAAGRCRYSDIESSARHAPSLSRRTLCKIRLWTCSCGSPSREVCWRNEATTHSRASSHRPPGDTPPGSARPRAAGSPGQLRYLP